MIFTYIFINVFFTVYGFVQVQLILIIIRWFNVKCDSIKLFKKILSICNNISPEKKEKKKNQMRYNTKIGVLITTAFLFCNEKIYEYEWDIVIFSS